MTSIIEAESLCKRYRIRHDDAAAQYRTLREDLTDMALAPWRRLRGRGRRGSSEDFWALRDVSFAVEAGEVVGVIGRNGAGKSTLLKILSRITKPTSGTAVIRGRVGSLLEVGTGFHPELSGRENLFLSGAILGMSGDEIRRKFDDIVQFAEIERFLDTPIKRYSSGMYVRLAFAVAAHLDPEVLLIDEVLAVGDAEFQKRCLGKIQQLTRDGRTVLFISHNMAAVQQLCERAIWLEGGAVRESGESATVCRNYLAGGGEELLERQWEPAAAPGNDRIRLRRASVRPLEGGELTISTPLLLRFEFDNLTEDARLHLNLSLFNSRNELILVSKSLSDRRWGERLPPGRLAATCRIPGALLNDGRHFVRLVVFEGQVPVHRFGEVLVFSLSDVLGRRHGWHGEWDGAVRPELEWTVEPQDEGAA